MNARGRQSGHVNSLRTFLRLRLIDLLGSFWCLKLDTEVKYAEMFSHLWGRWRHQHELSDEEINELPITSQARSSRGSPLVYLLLPDYPEAIPVGWLIVKLIESG